MFDSKTFSRVANMSQAHQSSLLPVESIRYNNVCWASPMRDAPETPQSAGQLKVLWWLRLKVVMKFPHIKYLLLPYVWLI